MNAERISQALNRPVNLHHEPMANILNELLTIVEQYQTEYQDTVKAIQKHYAEGKK